MNVLISTQNAKLDIRFIHGFLSKSCWAMGRTEAEVQACIDHSINFGVYLDDRQVGYARVVTDTVVFAYLMDLFIDPMHQGNGLARQLIASILDEPRLRAVKTWRLATSDAHGLYRKFGFHELEKPENMMELKTGK
jgi:GNAT superfamily N-acetyltransferase